MPIHIPKNNKRGVTDKLTKSPSSVFFHRKCFNEYNTDDAIIEGRKLLNKEFGSGLYKVDDVFDKNVELWSKEKKRKILNAAFLDGGFHFETTDDEISDISYINHEVSNQAYKRLHLIENNLVVSEKKRNLRCR